jgi:hypothetical protein
MKHLISLLVIFSFIYAGNTCAEDVSPPDWRDNGEEGLTFQHWDFTDPINWAPEVCSNVFGEPLTDIMGGVWTNGLQHPTDPTGMPATGWYFPEDGSGIILVIRNRPEETMFKVIRLQITSTKAPKIGITSDSGTTASNIFSQPIQHGGTPYYTYISDWILRPNPEYEVITITFPFDTILEEIVVDTWCTPEPACWIPALLVFWLIRRQFIVN